MTFSIEVHDFDSGKDALVVATPGDYYRMHKWAEANVPEDIADAEAGTSVLRLNLATAWFALKREGRLGEFGLPDALDAEAIVDALDHLAVSVEQYQGEPGGGSSPLPETAPPAQ